MGSYTKATEKRKADSAKQICAKKLKKSSVYEDEFLVLSDTLQECNGCYLIMKLMLFCCHLRMSMETLIMNVEMTQN